MRQIKLILIALLVVVTGLFGVTKISAMLSDEDEGPELQCQEQVLEISVQDEQSVLLNGVTASDAQDGDLTEQILIASVSQLVTDDTATVTYLVFDSDDNMAQLQRTVRYTDYRKPRISVDSPLIFSSDNTSALLSRISAEDVIDGDISDRIRISNLWATEYSNVYSVTVSATNSMGDTARVELPVIVQEDLAERPVIGLKEQLVYLQQGAAFDAGRYVTSVTVQQDSRSVNDVTVEHQVDTNEPGTYWVFYTYSENGIQGTAVLTVVVQ